MPPSMASSGLLDAWHTNHAQENVRVNAICPGSMNTPMAANFPRNTLHLIERRAFLERFAEPIEVAYAALYLASDESSYVTGSVMVVDGGYTHEIVHRSANCAPMSVTLLWAMRQFTPKRNANWLRVE